MAPGGDHGRSLTGGDGRMAGPGVVGPVGGHLADGRLGWDPRQRLGQPRAVTNPVPVRRRTRTDGARRLTLDGADLPGLRIDAQMDLAP